MSRDRWPYGVDPQLLRAVDEMRRLQKAMAFPESILQHDRELRAAVDRLIPQPLSDYLERMNLNHALQDQYATVARQLAESVRSLQFGAAVQGILKSCNESSDLVARLARDWDGSPIAKAMEQLRLQTSAFRDFDWDALWERHEASMAFAADNGWFIQPEHDFDVVSAIEECDGDVEKLDALFCEAIETVMGELCARVARQCPTRKPIVEEAFALYKEGRPIGSVPLFLMVADGIAHDAAGKSAYNTRGGRTTLADWVARTDVGPHGKQLANAHQLALSRHQGLSRHEVLHGIDHAYATRKNCLKAASFMGLVAWLMADQPDE